MTKIKIWVIQGVTIKLMGSAKGSTHLQTLINYKINLRLDQWHDKWNFKQKIKRCWIAKCSGNANLSFPITKQRLYHHSQIYLGIGSINVGTNTTINEYILRDSLMVFIIIEMVKKEIRQKT